MRANDRGFVAMVDAMVFIVVIVMAASVVVGVASSTDEGSDASGFLEDLMASEVRISDLAEGDDSLVRLSDLIALSLHTGQTGPSDYLHEVLDAYTGGAPYLLELTFEGPDGTTETMRMGSAGERLSSSSERTVPVTTGGSLTARLSLYSRAELLGAVGEVHADRDDVHGAYPADASAVAPGLAELGGVVAEHVLGVERDGHRVPAVVHQ